VDQAQRRASAGGAGFGAAIGFGLTGLAIVATFVLSSIFGWHGAARGIAWLICFGVALAVAIPLTVRNALGERKGMSRNPDLDDRG
jgi:hypothetical protein